MTDQATRTVPRRLEAMGFESPEVVVRSRLGDLMAFFAGLLAVANPAGIVRLRPHCAVAHRPVLVMTGGRRLRVHVLMAGGATQAPPVGLIADLDFRFMGQLRNLGQLLIQEHPVAIRAAV